MREGFKQLLASVALGEVGIVLSREPSRLSRTDKDWCHLMELCRLLDTLIGDADTVYDLNRLDDQLVLGIKDTLSVIELGTLKLRMQQGREAKAKRGELGRALAPGYVMDASQSIVPPRHQGSKPARAGSDGPPREEGVFSRFDVLGSARQTYRWFHEEHIGSRVCCGVAAAAASCTSAIGVSTARRRAICAVVTSTQGVCIAWALAVPPSISV